jgi:cyanate permease
MYRTMLGQGNTTLIAGLLVVMLLVGVFQLLWMFIHAPIFWVILVAWIALPLFPFAIRFLSLRFSSSDRRADGMC